MSYQQTVEFLYSRLPMFSRIGAPALKKDLTNTRLLCSYSGNPQEKFRTVHVGGTNGKGSVSHMLAAILQQAGYKTGLYTSPHLRDFRERIRINGDMIPEEKVVELTDHLKACINEIEPSFFEVTVAMAFQYFAEQKVDIAVIEVGLGGRLDSTNIITPLLSVITNIGFDHMNILGDTLPLIAAEKAGIIKPGVPVVIGEQHPETKDVFITQARETGSDITFASEEWEVSGEKISGEHKDLLQVNVSPSDDIIPALIELDLTGTYQLKNIKTVLSAVKELRKQGFLIDKEHITKALANVQSATGLMGRWQVLDRAPLIICDTGHNEDGIREVLRNIQQTSFSKLHLVIGMVKDKDISRVLSLLPADAAYYFCQPAIERAKPSEELAAEAALKGLRGQAYSSVNEALAAARKAAGKDDLIFVGGSTFVAAEVV